MNQYTTDDLARISLTAPHGRPDHPLSARSLDYAEPIPDESQIIHNRTAEGSRRLGGQSAAARRPRPPRGASRRAGPGRRSAGRNAS